MNDNLQDNNQNPENQNTPDRYRNMMPDYSVEYTDKDYRVGFGRRLGAYLLDSLFLGIITSIISLFFIDFGKMQSFAGTDIKDMMSLIEEMSRVLVPVQVITSLIYFSPEIFAGASLGKFTLSIRIADSERFSASANKLILRYLLKHISTILSGVAFLTAASFIGTIGSALFFILIIGFFWTLSERKQAFHDMLTDTAVYYKDELKDNQNPNFE